MIRKTDSYFADKLIFNLCSELILLLLLKPLQKKQLTKNPWQVTVYMTSTLNY